MDKYVVTPKAGVKQMIAGETRKILTTVGLSKGQKWKAKKGHGWWWIHRVAVVNVRLTDSEMERLFDIEKEDQP